MINYRQSLRLRCSRHVQRRDSRYVGEWMLKMELLSRRKRGKRQTTFMDIVEIKGVGVTEEDVRDRVRWRQLINCGEQEEEVWY